MLLLEKFLFHNLLLDDYGNDAFWKAVKLTLDPIDQLVISLAYYRYIWHHNTHCTDTTV